MRSTCPSISFFFDMVVVITNYKDPHFKFYPTLFSRRTKYSLLQSVLKLLQSMPLAYNSSPSFLSVKKKHKLKQTPRSESASELYRPSDRRLSAKWLPTFADRGCHVVSVTGKKKLPHTVSSSVMFFQRLQKICDDNKGKAITERGRGGPWGCETSKLPHFLENEITAVRFVSFRRRPPFTLRKIPSIHFC
jgi:hypothetical protein